MDVMLYARAKPAAPATDGRTLKRLEFEMALGIGHVEKGMAVETLRKAADASGCDLLFVLPAADGEGEIAMIRLPDRDRSHFVQVAASDGGFDFIEEEEIDADFLGFARACLNVLERLRADQAIRAPLAASR
jgi:hypothetical protein